MGTNKTVTFSGYTLSGADAADYALIQPTSTTANITPAPLTITANNQTLTYGFGGTSTALGTTAFTVSSGQLFNGDRISGVTLTTDDTTSGGGDYIATSGTGTANSPAHISPAIGSAVFSSGSASNYAIIYTPDSGRLTVNQATLTITANSQTLTYGFGGTSAALGTTAFTASGLYGSDSVTSVTLSTQRPRSAAHRTTMSAPGTSPRARQFIGIGLGNYTITYVGTPTDPVTGIRSPY